MTSDSPTTPTKLRKRLHILHSLSDSAHRGKEMTPEMGLERSASGTVTESITGTESSETEEEENTVHTPRVIPKARLEPALPPRPAHVHTMPTSSAWYELNLSIVVALVSPVGNWLTGGGDHVKNWLVILILVFYLHQVVEIPWSLYQSTLPRHSSDNKSENAHSLTRLNKIYLLLSVSSPIIGALLLHIVLGNGISAFLGLGSANDTSEGVLSWFSTTLFILATSIRPGSELVRRLQGEIVYLQASVAEHHSSATAEQEKHLTERLNAYTAELTARIAVLEKANRKYSQSIDEVYDYVDELEDTLEQREKAANEVTAGLAERLEALENSMAVTKTKNSKRKHSGWESWGWRDEKEEHAEYETWPTVFWRWFLTPHTPEWMIVGPRHALHRSRTAKPRSPTNGRLETIQEDAVLLSPSSSTLNLTAPKNTKSKRGPTNGMSVKIPAAFAPDAFSRSPRSTSSNSSSGLRTPPSPLPLPLPSPPLSQNETTKTIPAAKSSNSPTRTKRPMLPIRVITVVFSMLWTIFFIAFWPVIWPVQRVRRSWVR